MTIKNLDTNSIDLIQRTAIDIATGFLSAADIATGNPGVRRALRTAVVALKAEGFFDAAFGADDNGYVEHGGRTFAGCIKEIRRADRIADANAIGFSF